MREGEGWGFGLAIVLLMLVAAFVVIGVMALFVGVITGEPW